MLRRQMLRARNANVEAYINPDPIPNPNPNPNPYPALNQKPNHTHESNSVFGEVSMPEQLSPEHMSCHRQGYFLKCTCIFCSRRQKRFLGILRYAPPTHLLRSVSVARGPPHYLDTAKGTFWNVFYSRRHKCFLRI